MEYVQWNVTWQEIVLEMNFVLEIYVNQPVTAILVVQNFNIVRTIYAFKSYDVLQMITVKIHKFVRPIQLDRPNVLTYVKKLFVEGMLNAQQLIINQYVIVSLDTTETHTSVATKLNVMKTKTVQMIKYVKITCVKYHV